MVGQPLVSPGSSTSKATHLLTSQPVKQDTLVAVYHSNDMELKPFSSTHNHNYEGFHFTVAGINVPESNYQFISRPVAEPGTFVFYFDFASSTVHEDQRPVYDEIVEKYHHRKTPIIIIGETDGFGSKDYNTALAHHRSSIIIKELKDRGIKDSEIELRLKVRCCKSQAVTREALMATQNDRITWVHFD